MFKQSLNCILFLFNKTWLGSIDPVDRIGSLWAVKVWCQLSLALSSLEAESSRLKVSSEARFSTWNFIVYLLSYPYYDSLTDRRILYRRYDFPPPFRYFLMAQVFFLLLKKTIFISCSLFIADAPFPFGRYWFKFFPPIPFSVTIMVLGMHTATRLYITYVSLTGF